jgi:hypothetical protein
MECATQSVADVKIYINNTNGGGERHQKVGIITSIIKKAID